MVDFAACFLRDNLQQFRPFNKNLSAIVMIQSSRIPGGDHFPQQKGLIPGDFGLFQVIVDELDGVYTGLPGRFSPRVTTVTVTAQYERAEGCYEGK